MSCFCLFVKLGSLEMVFICGFISLLQPPLCEAFPHQVQASMTPLRSLRHGELLQGDDVVEGSSLAAPRHVLTSMTRVCMRAFEGVFVIWSFLKGLVVMLP
jgi:hypothetical protein